MTERSLRSSTKESRHDATSQAAWAIIQKEAMAKAAKTDRLRAARLAREDARIMPRAKQGRTFAEDTLGLRKV